MLSCGPLTKCISINSREMQILRAHSDLRNQRFWGATLTHTDASEILPESLAVECVRGQQHRRHMRAWCKHRITARLQSC